MTSELTPPDSNLIAGAVAVGAVCAMAATLILFPIIDRFVRPRFSLERGSAMVLLLILSLLVGMAGGAASFFWLSEREAAKFEEPLATRVERTY